MLGPRQQQIIEALADGKPCSLAALEHQVGASRRSLPRLPTGLAASPPSSTRPALSADNCAMLWRGSPRSRAFSGRASGQWL